MKNNRKAVRASVAASLALAFLAAVLPAQAQQASTQPQGGAYPSKPIRMVLGFPPGGPTDIVARIVGQKMADQLGQAIVVDNKPGAGGNIAAEMVAKAAPDGYTVLYNTSSIAIAPWVYAKVNFDPVKDFAPVALTAEMPLVLLVNPGVQARTAGELVQRIKSSPGKFNYGSSGVGAIEHLTSAQFVSAYGLDTSHIPYKGTAPALVDLIAGETEFMMTTLNTALPFVRDGKLRALGVSSSQRSKTLPDVPTIAESMKSDFASTAWQGIVAPAGTPREVVDKLNSVVNSVLKDPAVARQLADQGVSVLGGGSEQYGKFIQKELARWQRVVNESGARME